MTALLDLRLKALGLLKDLSNAIFRLDPAWCAGHGQEQTTDQELDQLLERLQQTIMEIEHG